MRINYKGFMRDRIRKNPVTINPSPPIHHDHRAIEVRN